MTRHRHERSSWFIAGGGIEWCYQCGAWRQLRFNADRSVSPIEGDEGRWHCPSGIGGANPAIQYVRAALQATERKTT